MLRRQQTAAVLRFGASRFRGAPSCRTAEVAKVISVFTSSGPLALCLSSAGCWRRRLRRASCGRQSPIWHNGRAASDDARGPCDSASPLSSAGITVRSLSDRSGRRAPGKVRCNAGQQHTVSDAVRRAVLAQYAAHKGWSVQLHHDNLVALAETQPDLKPVPSYPTLRRSCVPTVSTSAGVSPRAQPRRRASRGPHRRREIRSYESEYVNALWHWDCHHCSRKVLTARGELVTRSCFGVLDDRRGSPVTCSGIWPRRRRSSHTACRRHSRSAAAARGAGATTAQR